MKELEKLRILNDKLWTQDGKRHHIINRHHLDSHEWSMVLHLVIGLGLPCSIEKLTWCRDFAFIVYEPPLYPGLPAEKLVTISNEHLPEMGSTETMDLMESVYKIASTERNFEMLDLFQLKHPVTKYDIWEYKTLCIYGRENSG